MEHFQIGVSNIILKYIIEIFMLYKMYYLRDSHDKPNVIPGRFKLFRICA